MNPFEYIVRKFYGLSTVDSVDLIKAKMNAQSAAEIIENPTHDPHFRPTDHTMFGAISPVPEEEDFMTSQELHKRAEEILKSHGINS